MKSIASPSPAGACCYQNSACKSWHAAFAVMKRARSLLALRWVVLLCTVWTATLLQLGCASTAEIEHAVDYRNVGAVSVYDIEVKYGHVVIPFKGEKRPQRYGGWGVRMPIPDEMTVTWRTDPAAPPHRVVISALQSKASLTRQLRNWELRFNADNLELWRLEPTAPHNPNTLLQPRQYVKVFP